MYKKILVPMALEQNRNAAAAMGIAHKLLEKDGQIIALHVIEAIPGYAAMHMPADYQEKRQSEAIASMKAELGGVGDVKASVVIGHPGRTIQDFAEQHDIDCIIMASHQPGFQDYILGSTAAWVVRHAKCSVHVIR